MKIHLIRSEEIQVSRFLIILKMLKKFKGPVQFVAKEEKIVFLDSLEAEYNDNDYNISLEKKLPWSDLFGKCDKYRKLHDIPPDEAVVLLTDHGNDQYWFSSWEPSGRLNFFVQTSMWEYFIEAESCYPIIYELASIALAMAFCENLKEVEELAHVQPRGCMFDFCKNKEDVQFKLRTGDICPDCLDVMTEKNIEPAIARQVFDIIEWVRKQVLFRERFIITKQASKIKIDLNKKDLIFTELGNIAVHFTPQEMIFYRLFLKYIDGLYLSQVSNYHLELKGYYSRHTKEANLVTIENKVKDLADHTKNTLSEIISKIKRKITDAIGAEMAEYYIIKSGNGRHKILLDRNLILNYSEQYK